MYLPKTDEDFINAFPVVFKNYKQLGISNREAGPLDPKNQDLVKKTGHLLMHEDAPLKAVIDLIQN